MSQNFPSCPLRTVKIDRVGPLRRVISNWLSYRLALWLNHCSIRNTRSYIKCPVSRPWASSIAGTFTFVSIDAHFSVQSAPIAKGLRFRRYHLLTTIGDETLELTRLSNAPQNVRRCLPGSLSDCGKGLVADPPSNASGGGMRSGES